MMCVQYEYTKSLYSLGVSMFVEMITKLYWKYSVGPMYLWVMMLPADGKRLGEYLGSLGGMAAQCTNSAGCPNPGACDSTSLRSMTYTCLFEGLGRPVSLSSEGLLVGSSKLMIESQRNLSLKLQHWKLRGPMSGRMGRILRHMVMLLR